MEKQKKKDNIRNPYTEICMDRRSFLQKSAKGITGIAAVSSGIPILLSACSTNQKSSQTNNSSSTESLVDLGVLEEIKKGPFPLQIDYNAKLKDGWTTSEVKGMVYVTINDQGELYILSSICTHLGCTVPFADEEWKAKGVTFYCPCHGGQYDDQGKNVGGPPPRPLDGFSPIIQDGRIYIQVLNPIKREGNV